MTRKTKTNKNFFVYKKLRKMAVHYMITKRQAKKKKKKKEKKKKKRKKQNNNNKKHFWKDFEERS